MASPKAKGLFHKAIVQSGYTLPDLPREKALAKGKLLAEHFLLPMPARNSCGQSPPMPFGR